MPACCSCPALRLAEHPAGRQLFTDDLPFNELQADASSCADVAMLYFNIVIGPAFGLAQHLQERSRSYVPHQPLTAAKIFEGTW